MNVNNIKRFIQLVKLKYNYDLSHLSIPALKWKLTQILIQSNLKYVDDFLTRIEEDADFFREIFKEIFYAEIELFRTRNFWILLKDKILPELLTRDNNPQITLPVPNSSGDLFSLIILLNESNLSDMIKIRIEYRSEYIYESILDEKYSKQRMDISRDNLVSIFPEVQVNTYFKEINNQFYFKKQYFSKLQSAQFNFNNSVTPSSSLILFRNILLRYNLHFQNQIISYMVNELPKKGILALGYRENIHDYLNKNNSLNPYGNFENIYIKQE